MALIERDNVNAPDLRMRLPLSIFRAEPQHFLRFRLSTFDLTWTPAGINKPRPEAAHPTRRTLSRNFRTRPNAPKTLRILPRDSLPEKTSLLCTLDQVCTVNHEQH